MSQILKNLAMPGGKRSQKHTGGESPLEKMAGGLGAATYATSVYGDAGSQHAGSNGAIAMNAPVAPVVGGRRQKSRRQKHRRQKHRSSKHRSQKRRSSRR